jgi:hypothetical protein
MLLGGLVRRQFRTRARRRPARRRQEVAGCLLALEVAHLSDEGSVKRGQARGISRRSYIVRFGSVDERLHRLASALAQGEQLSHAGLREQRRRRGGRSLLCAAARNAQAPHCWTRRRELRRGRPPRASCPGPGPTPICGGGSRAGTRGSTPWSPPARQCTPRAHARDRAELPFACWPLGSSIKECRPCTSVVRLTIEYVEIFSHNLPNRNVGLIFRWGCLDGNFSA